ncbi:MAG: hypothetical protein JWM99_2119 [Verrucomicrobiales bacterium]|nr:hypothetical protein [Verrucomicrobiales bacterium]
MINFGCDATIILSSTLQITTNAVLNANGHNVSISGGDSVRVFSIAANVDFTAIGLTITNGKQMGTNGSPAGSVFGAGIYNAGGHVFLTNCLLLSNVCIGGSEMVAGQSGRGQAFGAAIYSVGGSLAINHTLISSNKCQGGRGGGGDAFGGAISSKDAIINITASEIRNNSATAGVGFGSYLYYKGGDGSGGALFIEGGAISITETGFSQNHAVGGAESPSLNNGGSIGPARGGAVFLTNTSANISFCKFLTNSAFCPDDGGRDSGGGLAHGGALFTSSYLDITDTLFSGNLSIGGPGSRGGGGEAAGGAIYNAAALTLERSTVAGNETRAGDGGSFIDGAKPGKGGGIFNAGRLSAANTTISLNQAFGANGAPGSAAEGGGIFDQGTMLLSQCTVASNDLHPGRDHYVYAIAPAQGGGIFSTNGLGTLQNTIVANNNGGSNCFGVLIDKGNNLSSDSSCQFTAPGSFNDTDPRISSLGDYGGPTPTMALLPGSPAIDHGLAIYCPPTDQRGIIRPFGSGCDIGAFELQVYPLNTLTLGNYSNHLIHLIFSGTIGRNYEVQGTTDLTHWMSFQTNAPGITGTFDIFYTNNTFDSARYFRVYAP